MKLTAWHFDLPLSHPFTISRETIDHQPTVIVELKQDGLAGYGEATTNAYYGVTLDSLTRAIADVRPVVEAFDLAAHPPAELWDQLAKRLAGDPFALCAIDLAAHDLWGKLQGEPLYRLWQLDPSTIPLSNYTIGIDTPERTVEKLQEFADWPLFKIKLGTPHDREIIRRLRAVTDAPFRVDANAGWRAEDVPEMAAFLKGHGVEFIEQPLPPDCWQAMKELRRTSPLPLVADESCREESDVACCDGFFHGINIKLVKCGGLTPARRMIEQARMRGLSVMVGCMTESTVGISAIAQLLPLLDAVDMDGAVLLAEDIAEGVRVVAGRCHYPDRPGCGVELVAVWSPRVAGCFRGWPKTPGKKPRTGTMPAVLARRCSAVSSAIRRTCEPRTPSVRQPSMGAAPGRDGRCIGRGRVGCVILWPWGRLAESTLR